jgi:hypothetical protein
MLTDDEMLIQSRNKQSRGHVLQAVVSQSGVVALACGHRTDIFDPSQAVIGLLCLGAASLIYVVKTYNNTKLTEPTTPGLLCCLSSVEG